MVPATRRGRFGEYNYRCACIAQLVEQLTLKQRNVADSRGRPRTNLQLTPISWQALPPDTDVSAATQDRAAMLASQYGRTGELALKRGLRRGMRGRRRANKRGGGPYG